MDLLQHFLSHLAISTDSRTVKQGDIFFALKGENFDGNTYAVNALNLGASLVVVDDPSLTLPKGKFLLVKDVLTALQKLAIDYRKLFDVPILGITGSNGKTTTKELLAAVISQKYKPLVTKGNLNNHIGVPITLLSARKENDFFIIEMGANHVGEIAMLSEIAQPDFGLITNIGKAHLDGFGGEEGVKRGKSELYKFLEKTDGTIFCNAVDQVLLSLLPPNAKTIVYDVLQKLEILQTSPTITYSYKGKQIATHLFGVYNLPNIAAAIAVGEFFGIEEAQINEAIAAYTPSNNRSEISSLNGNVIIKDAYNANPSSLLASLHSFLDQKNHENQIIVLGDMLELGEASEAEHHQILTFVTPFKLFKKIFIGPRFYQFKTQFEGEFYENVTEASQHVDLSTYSDKQILLKGSRGIAVEKILK
ncbi:MAG TPA: UDP-N-acetylmuramoyl-tripeptide--D-alanyl-D-alanine ligase [Saprospiraceae bacterium]|nr:UDP-N-acetylmuramoyl-tripeptide--D-alanyl-D-alanine ligase [Saprospiraceae bacterium]